MSNIPGNSFFTINIHVVNAKFSSLPRIQGEKKIDSQDVLGKYILIEDFTQTKQITFQYVNSS
jgi:hypothetical protein